MSPAMNSGEAGSSVGGLLQLYAGVKALADPAANTTSAMPTTEPSQPNITEPSRQSFLNCACATDDEQTVCEGVICGRRVSGFIRIEGPHSDRPSGSSCRHCHVDHVCLSAAAAGLTWRRRALWPVINDGGLHVSRVEPDARILLGGVG